MSLALVGTGHPSRTGARTPRPALLTRSGPGGSPKAGVPAPTRDPQRTRWSVVDRAYAVRASRYGKLPHSPMLAKVRRGAADRCDTPDPEVNSR